MISPATLPDIAENKDVKQQGVLRSLPLLAVISLVFFCLEFILAVARETSFPAMPCDDTAMRSKDFSGLAGAKA
jgi:hypothetical protein